MGIDESSLDAATDRDDSRHALRLACIVVLAIVLAGLLALPIAGQDNYRAYSLFYEQFSRIELAPLLLTGGFLIVLLMHLTRSAPVEGARASMSDFAGSRSGADKRWLAVAVAVVVWFGVRFVFHQYAFTDDEYAALVQAQIFAHGASHATVPAQWCPFIGAITPTSIDAVSGCTWHLVFLPLHSLFRAPFVALNIDQVAGALTAALSLLLVMSIGEKQWPDKPHRAWLAAIFFATSTQMLFMSMTFFSMSTHLLASLVWLWLYVDNRRGSLLLLPWVGFVAIGLHSPFPHVYFAAFFLLRYLRDRRFALSAYVGVVYVFAVLYWHAYFNRRLGGGPTASVANVAATAQVARHLFAWPALEIRIAMVMHVALAVVWNSPIVIILALACTFRWSKLDAFSRDAALGVIFVLLTRTFLNATPQGVGWGYRYLHDSLGTIALLAALGAESLTAVVGSVWSRRWILIASAIVVFVQLPMRFVNVDQIIGPYRRASDWLASRPADAVLFPADVVPWGRQLVRNDPFFARGPVLVNSTTLQKTTIDSIRRIAPRVEVVTVNQLRTIGLPILKFILPR